jgi:uncharacterized membrane protein
VRLTTPGVRVAIASAIGAASLGIALALGAPWQAAVLLGSDIAAATWLAWMWSSIARMGGADMREVARLEEPTRLIADVLLLAASVGCLVGVGLDLAEAGDRAGGTKAAVVVLAVVSVLVSWTVVHTVFALKYARRYYGDPEGGVDFDGTTAPTFVDFAYLAFTIGMTYQVSDTGFTTQEMRRLALGHAALSFLFGTFILAVTINVVAGFV